jgi:FeS assembly SUF system protein
MLEATYRSLDLVDSEARTDSTEYVLEGDSPTPPEGPVDRAAIEEAAREALRHVYDPEIPANIYDLGLIYEIVVTEQGRVQVKMTLTAPACPMAGWLVQQVHARLLALPGATGARTELVWDPPWTPARMSEAARLELGFY